MRHFDKPHGPRSAHQQQHVRAEISRQVAEFLAQGGRIEQLSGPQLKPHREVRVNAGLARDAS